MHAPPYFNRALIAPALPLRGLTLPSPLVSMAINTMRAGHAHAQGLQAWVKVTWSRDASDQRPSSPFRRPWPLQPQASRFRNMLRARLELGASLVRWCVVFIGSLKRHLQLLQVASPQRRERANRAAKSAERVPRKPAGIIFFVFTKRMAKTTVRAAEVPSARTVEAAT